MAINFDTLPNDKPITGAQPGTYYAVIEKAEMKQGKDTTKPPYLNLFLALTTKEGKPAGKIYDILSESDHEIVRFKLKRFITALNIPVTGMFELKDLTKVVVGKQLIVDIAHDKSEPPRPQVDLFSGKAYYSLSEREEAFKAAVGEQATEDLTPVDVPGPFNAPDANDAPAIENVDY